MAGNGSRDWSDTVDLPPGQHAAAELVLSADIAPAVTTDEWEFSVRSEANQELRWDWAAFQAMPSQPIAVDLHCVDGWSVLASNWEATSLHHFFDSVSTSAVHVVVHSYSGYTVNLPLEDLLEMPTWLAFAYEGRDLTPERGGPARLLVPHLYLWKSVKWVRGITLTLHDQPGTRERVGYHNYGDPWRQQRTRADDGRRPPQPRGSS